MDDIFQLLLHSMTILKEMERLTKINIYGVGEYIKKQNELNNTIVEIIELMVSKKD